MERQTYLLPHDPDATGIARRLVEEHLSPLLEEERADDLVLMTSEVVANAIRHSPALPNGGHDLLFEVDDESIRIAVTAGGRHLDADSTGFETPTDSRYGLFIIDGRSDRWGFSLDGVKGVWFMVDR